MNSDRPKYLVVYDAIRADLANGKYRVGDRLPSLEVLTDRYDAAFNTVRSAQRMLSKEGLLRAEQGRGVFVTALPVKTAASVQELVSDKVAEAVRLLTEVQAVLARSPVA